MAGAGKRLLEKSFLLTPLREGRRSHPRGVRRRFLDFYSRPCGRGDQCAARMFQRFTSISTHAPAGGATRRQQGSHTVRSISTHAPAGGATQSLVTVAPVFSVFLLTPLREGRLSGLIFLDYLRPFLLTPLREGRHGAPLQASRAAGQFLLTPLREGRHEAASGIRRFLRYFYSRPCGRGDPYPASLPPERGSISTHAPAGGATLEERRKSIGGSISTHAPAGGATRIRT